MAHAISPGNEFLREHGLVLSLSVGLHAVLLVLLTLNLNLMPRRELQPTRMAIEATVVDAKALRRREARDEARQRELARAEQQRREQAEQQRRQAEQAREAEREAEVQRRQAEERRATEQRRAEQQKREQAEAKAAQQKKEADARAAQQKQDAEAKAARQKQEAEAQKKAAADAARKAEADRKAAQARAELARQMAAEEDLLAAADSGLLDQYAEIIRQKVERNWIRPASAREGISCVVLVKQIPGGEVVDVRVTECNGDAAVVRSIEAAVLRASPLPPPPDPTLFDRSLRFDFRPRD